MDDKKLLTFNKESSFPFGGGRIDEILFAFERFCSIYGRVDDIDTKKEIIMAVIALLGAPEELDTSFVVGEENYHVYRWIGREVYVMARRLEDLYPGGDFYILPNQTISNDQWLMFLRKVTIHDTFGFFGAYYAHIPTPFKDKKVYVYVAWGTLTRRVKIGISSKPKERMKNFSEPTELKAFFEVNENALKIERLALELLAQKHDRQGEWFSSATVEEAIEAVRKAIEMVPKDGKLKTTPSDLYWEIKEKLPKEYRRDVTDIHDILLPDGKVLTVLWESCSGSYLSVSLNSLAFTLGIDEMELLKIIRDDILLIKDTTTPDHKFWFGVPCYLLPDRFPELFEMWPALKNHCCFLDLFR